MQVLAETGGATATAFEQIDKVRVFFHVQSSSVVRLQVVSQLGFQAFSS